jgi:NAD+ diphosphatase
VVGVIVERGKEVLLVQNVGWPATFFGLVTGFLEKHDESPEQGAVRELKEEVGLDVGVEDLTLVHVNSFTRLNQVLIVYHVKVADSAEAKPDPNEIAAIKWVPIHKIKIWNEGTGPALRRWIRSKAKL